MTEPSVGNLPDPLTSSAPAEFIERLRELREWAGNPALRRLRQLGGSTIGGDGSHVDALPVSTTSYVLRGDRLPRMEFVRAFVTACLRARHLDRPGIATQLERWHEAWLKLCRARSAREARRTSPEEPPTASPVVPRQLPVDVADFTGRAGELVVLERALGSAHRPDAVVISAITGVGGVGKSALAIHAAHRIAGRFPDGQLYVDLHGATAGMAPLAPLEVLGRFLRALGVAGIDIPDQVGEAAARFRTEAADRRLLVVLDNAHDEAQVRPLLPGTPGSQVLVTSRQTLAGVDIAGQVHLDALSEPEAIELLGRMVGAERMAAEPAAAVTVVHRCGRLPLALRIAGARLATRPTWSLANFADRLAGDQRLAELRVADLAVRTSFDVSYQQLRDSDDPTDQAATEAFRLLGAWDGADLAIPPAARLLDRPEAETGRVLERLVDAGLLESPAPGRYRLHDLLRSYARELAAPEVAALGRIVQFYTATASHAYLLLRPGDDRFTRDERWLTGGLRFADLSEALAWLEEERANLLAAVALATAHPDRLAAAAIQLAQVLGGFFLHRSYWRDWEQVARTALPIAHRTGDRRAEAQVHSNLAAVNELCGDYPRAAVHLIQSLELRRALDDREGEGRSLANLTGVYVRTGELTEAVDCGERSLAITGELADRSAEAIALQNLSLAYVALGRYEQALECGQRALARHREMGNQPGVAHALGNLATVYRKLARYREAIEYAEQSLERRRRIGHRRGEADCLANLGATYHTQGRHTDALAAFQQSLVICRELGLRRDEAESLRQAAAVLSAIGRADEARDHLHEALPIYERLRLPEAAEVRAILGEA